MTTNPAPDEGPAEGGQFERLIARQAFRAPPAEWRKAILDGAAADSPVPAVAARARFRPGPEESAGPWRVLWERLASGWALAGAAWALILALDQFASAPMDSGPRLAAPLSAAAVETIREQQREVIGQLAVIGEPEPPPQPPGDRPRAAHPERDDLPVAGERRGDRFFAMGAWAESRRQPSTSRPLV